MEDQVWMGVMVMLRVIDNLIVREKLTTIRQRGIDPASFRRGVSDIGRYMAYEFADTCNGVKWRLKPPLALRVVLR